MRKKDKLGHTIIKDNQQHLVNEITSCKDNILPKIVRKMTMKKKYPSSFNKMFDFTFNHSIFVE